MRLLIDTHLLLWILTSPDRVSQAARDFVLDGQNELLFSVVSVWEIVIKAGLGRSDFSVDPRMFRARLLAASYTELPVNAEHVFAMIGMPLLHRDPFDRMLIAQAVAEGAVLITSDAMVAGYEGPIRLV